MPMNVVLDIGGKQMNAAEGQLLKVEKVDAPEGGTVTLDKVMAVVDGANSRYGTPYVEGAQVEATVVKHGKAKKINVFKYKAKKRYRNTRGHRQQFSLLKVDAVKVP